MLYSECMQTFVENGEIFCYGIIRNYRPNLYKVFKEGKDFKLHLWKPKWNLESKGHWQYIGNVLTMKTKSDLKRRFIGRFFGQGDFILTDTFYAAHFHRVKTHHQDLAEATESAKVYQAEINGGELPF